MLRFFINIYMGKYKICVYAICKNEEKFVDRWFESMKEADEIIVMDTGSTDKTVEKLRSHGVQVYEKVISPWRFDVARNESLKLIPDDVDFCCCIDLDEYFDAGWRDELEKHLTDNTTQVKYRYTWNFNEDGSEGIVFFAEKIHRNKFFCWEHPVHETLKQTDFSKHEILTIPTLHLNHKADNEKSRANYLPLLELSVKEDPTSDRNMHYLGREYFFHKEYEKAIETLKKHLTMPNSLWDEERSRSCIYIAYSYESLGKNRMAIKYFKLAIAENPDTREPYMELSKHYFRKKKYLDAIITLNSLIKIHKRRYTYLSLPDSWDETPFDLLAICYFYVKNYSKSLFFGRIALSLKPHDKRLKSNLNLYEKSCGINN